MGRRGKRMGRETGHLIPQLEQPATALNSKIPQFESYGEDRTENRAKLYNQFY
jgi:hypothetical protein